MRCAVLVCGVVAALAGCGGESADKGAVGAGRPPNPNLPVNASPDGKAEISASPRNALEFNHRNIRANPGKLTITMRNRSNGLTHGLVVHGPTFPSTAKRIRKKGPIVQSGGTSTVTFEAKPDSDYEFFCPVPGHEEGGMLGEISVR